MHNIKRLEEPNILKDNKQKWTEELLFEIQTKGGFDKVDDSFKRHYKQNEVSEVLKKMNGGGYCYYCEQKIGKTDYAHIEHYKPKNQFPELCFEWKNLHYSCHKCNIKKGVKWNLEHPILDPCDEDTNIENHISYSLWELSGESDNALTTIDTFYLNDIEEREELVDARKKVFLELLRVIESINMISDKVKKRKKIEDLKRHASEFEFKGMIKFSIKSFIKEDNLL
ncbi:HNH endonuclease [Saccharicrinis sp. FJH2]|uniref:HNH endonuclease n=1 Tax=Saccharicrinis sp. FJH65 TaxID=3344659 RepID=UPI0035F49C5A